MIKKVACLIVLFALAVSFWGGCETMTRTREQQMQKYSRLEDINRRLLAEVDGDRELARRDLDQRRTRREQTASKQTKISTINK